MCLLLKIYDPCVHGSFIKASKCAFPYRSMTPVFTAVVLEITSVLVRQCLMEISVITASVSTGNVMQKMTGASVIRVLQVYKIPIE